MLMFRTFQQEATQVRKVLTGAIGTTTLIPLARSATYQQGRMKTTEVLAGWLSQVSQETMTQEQLKINVSCYISRLNAAIETFHSYGFLFDPSELKASRDYIKGQIECYRLHQPRIEGLINGNFNR